jgi:hypothetical protein
LLLTGGQAITVNTSFFQNAYPTTEENKDKATVEEKGIAGAENTWEEILKDMPLLAIQYLQVFVLCSEILILMQYLRPTQSLGHHTSFCGFFAPPQFYSTCLSQLFATCTLW